MRISAWIAHDGSLSLSLTHSLILGLPFFFFFCLFRLAAIVVVVVVVAVVVVVD